MMRLLLLLPLMLGLAACAERSAPRPPSEVTESLKPHRDIPFRKDGELLFLRADGTPIVQIAIEIAETDSARQRGLMERRSLPPQSGMLFIFPREEMQSFWMANTPLSLDIIYVNADSQIVHIAKYTRPFSTNPIPSEYPARFVVEVPAGFADRYGIVEGDRIRFWRTGD